MLELIKFFVATLLATGGLAIAILQWPRKGLGWELLYFHVIKADSTSSATLEIGGRKVKASHVDVVLIEVVNTGNKDIEAEHYQRPLTFNFGDNAQVLSAEVLYEDPKAICASLSHSTDTVTLEPVLLNTGDIVGMEMLIADAEDFSWDGRIVGVTKIKQMTPQLRMARICVLALVLSLIAFPGVYLPYFFPVFLSELLPPALLGVAWGLQTVGMILLVMGIVLATRVIRRQKRRTLSRQPVKSGPWERPQG